MPLLVLLFRNRLNRPRHIDMASLSSQDESREAPVASIAQQKERAKFAPIVLWALLTAVLVGVIGSGISSLGKQRSLTPSLNATTASHLPIYGAVPDFQLVDQYDRPVRKTDFEGKVWVASLIFTSCSDECPLITTEMARLQSELTHLPDLRLVSISVDPERDVPAVLSQYADRFNADPRFWLFLTGDKRVIYRLARDGFRLGIVDPTEASHPSPVKDSALSGSQQVVDHPPASSVIWTTRLPQHFRRWLRYVAPAMAFADHDPAKTPLHSTRFVLVDRHAQIRGYYESQEAAALQRLRQHLQIVLREG